MTVKLALLKSGEEVISDVAEMVVERRWLDTSSTILMQQNSLVD